MYTVDDQYGECRVTNEALGCVLNSEARFMSRILGRRVMGLSVVLHEPCMPVSLRRDLAYMQAHPKKFLRLRHKRFPGEAA